MKSPDETSKAESGHEYSVCPLWVGYILLNPFRNLTQNPRKTLGPYVREGMTVLDFGCAMGFFTLPMARMVGSQGKVIAADIQEGMLRSLEKRGRRAGLTDRIVPHLCPPDTLGLEGYKEKIDFILAFAVVHEVADPERLFREFHALLKPDGTLLVAEPKGHVDEEAFEKSLKHATANGFTLTGHPKIFRSHAALLVKSPPPN